MSEFEATQRYWWARIRQALKKGDVFGAQRFIDDVECGGFANDGLADVLRERIGKTFTAGCIALGDPAPLDKERDHE